MATGGRTGSAAYRRQGSPSYRNPSNASYATASNPYSSRYKAFKARGQAKAASRSMRGDVSLHGSGYLQDAAYILNDTSGCQDEGDAAASSVVRATSVARDRAINHFLNKADLSEYRLEEPLPKASTGKLGSGVISTGLQSQPAPAASPKIHFRRSLGSAAAPSSSKPVVAAGSAPAQARATLPAAAVGTLHPASHPSATWTQRYAAQHAQQAAGRHPMQRRLAANLKPQYMYRNQGLPQAAHAIRGRAAVTGPAATRTISHAAYARIRTDCMTYRHIMATSPSNSMLRHTARIIGMQKSMQIVRTGSIHHVENVSRGAAATSRPVTIRRAAPRPAATSRPKYAALAQQRANAPSLYTRTATAHGRAYQPTAKYAAVLLPGARSTRMPKAKLAAQRYGMKLHRGAGKKVVAHERDSAHAGRHLRLARARKGAGRKRADWLKKRSQPSLYRKNPSRLRAAAKSAGRAYQKVNKIAYTASLFTPDADQDMGDAAASVPAKLLKETGRRAAGKTLRAAKGKLGPLSAKKQIGTNPSIRRANVRTMRKAMAKSAGRGAAAASGTVDVRSLHDIAHNLISVLKKVPQQISKDMAVAMGTAAGSPVLPILAAIFGVIIIPSLIITIITSIIFPALNGQTGTGTLTGDAAEFAAFLKNDMGMNNAQAAAVIGNAVVESGNGSWTAGDPIVLGWGALEGNGIGHGIFQWSFGRADALMALAQSQGKDWTDKDVQMQYFKSEWDSAWGLAQGSIDYYTDGEYSGVASKETFENETSVDMAALEFLAGWERAAKTTSHWKNRVACAQYIYSALESGAGGTINDGSLSGSQQAVVSAAYATPSPGYGYCAAWVTNVFQNAGIGYFGGNACDMYSSWCTSSNLDDLKPGMIIAVSTHNLDAAGRIYGHVGIYIGNGQVMDNIGPIRTVDVNQWIQTFSGVVPAKWGWIGNIPLS